MSGAVFTLGNSVSGSLGLGDALSKFGRVAATGLTIEQDPDTVNSYLTTRYAGLSAVTSGGVTTFLNPSLVVIPSAYNNGIVYSLHSKQVNTGDFTVTRNTEARRVNSAGRIASVGSGLPRLDYLTSGGTVGTPALLVEPAGTNLAFHSETWASGNNWTFDAVTRVTGSTSAFLAPDGSFTANAISPTSANVFHGLFSNSPTQNTYISGTIYTQSAFFKQGTGVAGRYVQLTYTGGGQFTQNGYANFDLQLGTVAVVSGTSADTNRAARIENYGNGWHRCSFTATCNVSGTGVGVLPVLVDASGNTRAQSFAGVTGDILYGWGAQLETGSVATSYIPTTAGTGSRSADVISVTGAVSGSIGQTQGTIYAEVVAVSGVNTGRIISVTELGQPVNNRIFFFLNTNHQLEIFVRSNNNTSSNGSVGGSAATLLVNGINKIAYAYDGVAGSNALAINGTIVATNSQTFSFTQALSRVNVAILETDFTVAQNQRIRAAALYTTRLTNQQLQLLTT